MSWPGGAAARGVLVALAGVLLSACSGANSGDTTRTGSGQHSTAAPSAASNAVPSGDVSGVPGASATSAGTAGLGPSPAAVACRGMRPLPADVRVDVPQAGESTAPVRLVVGQTLLVSFGTDCAAGAELSATGPLAVAPGASVVRADDGTTHAVRYVGTAPGSAQVAVVRGPRCRPGELCPQFRTLLTVVPVTVTPPTGTPPSS